MLVEFSVENYRSIKERQTLSLVASADSELPGNCMEAGKLKLLKAAGVYGANASGKSNLIKALDIMRWIVVESANFKPGDKLPVNSFRLDDEWEEKPSSFEVVFLHNGIQYQYGFSATKEHIFDEWLFATPGPRAQKWFERSFDNEKNHSEFTFGSFLKGQRETLREKTRDNALFLSVAAQWNNEQLMAVYTWFKEKLRTVTTKYQFEPVTARMLKDAEKNKEQENAIHDLVTSFLQEADLGISGIDIKEITSDIISKVESPPGMPDEVREKVIQEYQKRPSLITKFLHRNQKTGKEVYFTLEEESDGTQRLFQLIGPLFEIVWKGHTVFIDELESSLHPLLTRSLIEFFQNPRINTAGAQLVFATHDTTLLNTELFRRDQIWFTEKDNQGSTNLMPLSDYKARKKEALQKGYLAGRYGAVPILKEFSPQFSRTKKKEF